MKLDSTATQNESTDGIVIVVAVATATLMGLASVGIRLDQLQ
jgi:hypothetical protein